MKVRDQFHKLSEMFGTANHPRIAEFYTRLGKSIESWSEFFAFQAELTQRGLVDYYKFYTLESEALK